MKDKTDVLIIGAGVLGCFAARNLSRYKLDITVLEQHEDVCTGISRANTGIIYQGYDQHPGTVKADLCRRASLNFPHLCSELDVPYRNCGLLMISFGNNADRVLERKLSQGMANNVKGISIISGSCVYEMEPALSPGIRRALYAEDTYVVNPWDLGIAAFENARANGVRFCFNEEVLGIRRANGRFIAETSGQELQAEKILCCAGSGSDLIWKMAEKSRVRIVPQAADYLVFDTTAGGMISHVISVEPEEKGGGITLIPTVDGNILAGPTRRDAAGEPEGATATEGITELKQKCKRVLPGLSMDSIIRNFGAVRPNPHLVNEDGSLSERSLKDFVILEEDGFFALMGIKTPGLTCADELGKYMADKILCSFDRKPEKKKEFDPVRKGILKVSGMIDRNPENLMKLPADYREIICRCRNVSRGEVLEAIRRGAVTVDGVKRRAGSGMGRCQGGYCMEKIIHILAEETGTDEHDFL